MSRSSAGLPFRNISLLLAAAVLAPSVHGAVLYKDVTSTDMNAVGNWSTVNNAATPDPGSIGTGDELYFNSMFAPSAGTYTASLTNDLAAGSVRLDNGVNNANVVIDGNYTLTLSGAGDASYTNAGFILNSAAGGSLTVNSNVSLSASQTWVSSRILTIGGALNLGSNLLTLSTAGSGVITINGVISGSRPNGTTDGTNTAILLSGTSTGTVKLTNASNSFTGNIQFGGSSSNTLEFTSAGALGATATAQIRFRNTGGAGSILRYTGTTATTVQKAIQCDTSIGVRLQSNSVGGSVDFSGSWAASGSSRPVFLGGTGVGDNKVSGVLVGSNLTKNDAGRWILSNAANTYAGITSINGGTLGVAKLANGGLSSSLGATTNVAANLVFNGGWLDYVGTGGDSTNRAFTVTGTGLALSNNGSGAITWTGGTTAFTTTNTAYTFKLGGSNTDGNVFGTVIANNGTGAISLTKQDAGTWAIIGSNTHSGTTTLSAGTLQVGNDAAFGTGTLALNGGTLSSNGSTGRSFTNAVTIGANMVLGSAVNTGALALGGNVALGGAVRVLTVNSAVTLGGIISDGGLTKAGNATLTLSGQNTYASGTIVDAGTLALSASNRLDDAGALTVNAAGTFDLGGFSDTVGAFVLAGGSVGNGTLTAASYDVRSGTISGAIAGSGTLTKSTSGTATLSGTSTFAGATAINAGTLVVSGSLSGSAVTVANAATLSVTGSVTGGTVAIASGALATVSSAGTLSGSTVSVAGGGILRGTGNVGTVALANGATFEAGLSGLGSVTADALSIDSNAEGILSILGVSNYSLSAAFTLGTVTFASGGTLRLDVSGAAGIGEYSLLSYTGTLDSASVTHSVFSPGNRKSAELNFDTPGLVKYVVNGTQPRWIGSTSDWSGAAAWSIGPLETDTDIFQSGDALVFDDDASSGAVSITANVDPSSLAFTGDTLAYTLTGAGGVITSGALSKSGSADLTIVAANSFDGGAALTGGRVRVGDNAALGTGTVTLGGGVALSSDGASARSLANNLVLAGSATLGDATESGALAFTGTVDLGGASRTLTVASATTLQGVVSNGGLVKAGIGTLTLEGNNTHGSGTTVSAGKLRVGGNTALGTGTLTLSGGSISASSGTARSLANAVVLTANATFGDAVDNGALTFSGTVDLGGAVRSLTLASNATLSGVISNGGLTKLGNGTLTLSGAGGTYGLGTTVSAGTLALGASNVLADAGSVTVDGGTLSLGANSDTVGVFSLTSGSITGSGTLSASSFAFEHASSVSVAAGLGGSAALTKSGSGNLTLSGTSTYTGGTTVSAGTLTLGHATNTLANAGAVTVSGGTLAVGSNADTIGALSISAGDITGSGTLTASSVSATNASAAAISAVLAGTGTALTKSGNGTLTLTGSNTHTGATTVNAGTLQIGTGSTAGDIGTVSTANFVTVATGATLRFFRSGTIDYKSSNRMRLVSGGGDIVIDGGAKFFNYAGVTGTTGTGFAEANSWSTFSGRLIVLGGSEFQTIRNGRTAMGSAQIVLGDATTSGILSQIEGNWTWTNNIRLDGASNIIRNNSALGASGRFMKIQGVISGSGNVTFGDSTGALSATTSGALANPSDTALVLTGSNTLSGQVTIDTFLRVGGVGGDDATLGAGASGSLGTASVVINSGKMLTFSRSDTHTVANLISGDGSVRIGSTGIAGTATQDITLSGANTYTGGTLLLQGTLRTGSISSLGSYTTGATGALTVRNGATFVFTGTSNASTARNLVIDSGAATIEVSDANTTLTWSDSATKGGATGGLITKSGAGTLVLDGAITSGGTTAVKVSGGTLRLNGTNTYGGATTVDVGATLDIAGSGVLDAATALTVNGTLGFSTSSNQSLSAGIAGAGSLLKSGNGTLTLSADNSGFTGSVTVSGGELALGHASGLGGVLVTVNTNGTLNLGSYASTNAVALNGGALTNFSNWTGALVVNYAGASGSDIDAALATYGRQAVSVRAGGTLGLAGLTRGVVLEGGSLTGDLSAFTGDLTVRSAISFSTASAGGRIQLETGGSIDYAGRSATDTIHYLAGSLTDAAGFTGDIVLEGATTALVSGRFGSGRIVVGTGKAADIGVGFTNDLRLDGGTISGSSLNNLTGTVSVADGTTLDLDGASNNLLISNTGAGITVESGATLKGTGSIGTLTVQSGAVLAPGNSPGLIVAEDLVLQGGSMTFEVASLTDPFGLPFPTPGSDHDSVTVTDLLDLSGLSTSSRFLLNLVSLAGDGVTLGAPQGWDPAINFELTLFTYGRLDLGGQSNITDLFTIDTTGFLDADGVQVDAVHFSVVNNEAANQVLLVYSTIPEPSTYGMMLGGLALAAAAYRRRRLKSKV